MKKRLLRLHRSYNTLHKYQKFLKKFDFDRSVCVPAICYSDSILTISLKIAPMPWTIIHDKFREDISSNQKFSIHALDTDRSVGMTAICDSDAISADPTSSSSFLARKGRVQNFRSISQKLRN